MVPNSNSLNLVTMEMIIERRKQVKVAQDALYWGLANLFVVSIFSVDLFTGLLSSYVSSYSLVQIIFGIEITLVILFSINASYDFYLHSWLRLWMKPIEVTKEQKKLFRIKDNELGFKDYKPKESKEEKTSTPLTMISPKFSILPEKDSASTPISSSLVTGKPSLNTSFYTSTPSNLSLVNNSSPNLSFNSSWYLPKPAFDSFEGSFNESSLRRRMTPTATSSNSIKDEASLKKYIKEFEEVEEKVSQMSEAEQHVVQNQISPYPLQKQVIDLTNVSYQPSDDSSLFANANDENFSNVFMNTESADSICCRLNIPPNKLSKWVENIKNWINTTILTKIVKDIEKINEDLIKAGLIESLVGEVGLSQIRQLSTLKSKEIPTLSTILPYLELSIHQEYLVKRLQDLVKRKLSNFVWNGGASHKGKPWTEEWPTDTQIIMHFFCTYMNSKLPSNPNYPETKAFTGQYFRVLEGGLDKPSASKVQIHILQTKIYPPHFNVVVKADDIIEIPKGRNNVFYAIIIFLYFIKTKHYGFLGRVNLGPSGVNILWTIE